MNDRAYQMQAKAHRAVANALSLGELQREACATCGHATAQAHHDSYYPDKWLDVRWLCATHHQQWHQKNEPIWPSIYEFHPSDEYQPKSEGLGGRPPRPWYWKARKGWYTRMGGKIHNLGGDYDRAAARFHELFKDMAQSNPGSVQH